MRKALIAFVAVAMLVVPSTALAAGNAHSGPTRATCCTNDLCRDFAVRLTLDGERIVRIVVMPGGHAG